jgi:hypothetical protein
MPDYPGYAVTSDGWVWSDTPSKGNPEGRWLTQLSDRHGLLTVTLRVDNANVKRYVHELVLETFVGPVPEGSVARHKTINTLWNDLENLEYGPRQKQYEE